MQLTSIVSTRVAYSANLQVKTSIDRKERDFWVYYYLQLEDTMKYILKNIFIWIIKEQFHRKGEGTWRQLKGCQNPINDILCQFKSLHIVDTPVAKWASTERQRFLDL